MYGLKEINLRGPLEMGMSVRNMLVMILTILLVVFAVGMDMLGTLLGVIFIICGLLIFYGGIVSRFRWAKTSGKIIGLGEQEKEIDENRQRVEFEYLVNGIRFFGSFRAREGEYNLKQEINISYSSKNPKSYRTQHWVADIVIGGLLAMFGVFAILYEFS